MIEAGFPTDKIACYIGRMQVWRMRGLMVAKQGGGLCGARFPQE